MSTHPLLQQWCEAVTSGDLQKVLALYEGDALLNPTLSPNICCGHEAMADYFKGFLKKGIKKIHYSIEGELYLDHALVLMGHYEFAGDESSLKADFTFVLKESGPGEFKILAQHSSHSNP